MKRQTFLISFCIHQVTKTTFPPERLPTVAFLWGRGGLFFFFMKVTLVTTELLHIHYICFPKFTTSYLTDLSLWQKDSCVKNSSVHLGEERCLPAHRALLY